jgi:amino acid transporter
MKLFSKATEKLRTRELIFMGLAFLAPTALVPLFGGAVKEAHGAPALSSIIALLATLITAVSYLRLARDYEWSGSIYMYAKKSMHRYAGFLTGWTAALFYALAVASTVMIAARILHERIPSIPYILIAFVFIFGAAAVNYAGPRLAAYVCLGIFLLIFASFFVFALVCLMSVSKGAGDIVSLVPFTPQGANFGGILLGGGAACMAFLGFESITSLSEETHNPKVKVSRAMIYSIIGAGILFFVESYVAGIVLGAPNPDASVSAYSISAAARKAGGPPMVGIYNFAMVMSGPLVAIVGQSAASRMLFTMGRTGTLPRRVFSWRKKETMIPVADMLMVVVFCFIAALLKTRLSMVTELMRFSGSLLFVMVHVMLLYKYFFLKQRTTRLTIRNFWVVFPEIVFPSLGFLFGFAMWINVDPAAFIEGLIWLVVGVAIITVMYQYRHRTRRPTKTTKDLAAIPASTSTASESDAVSEADDTSDDDTSNDEVIENAD